MTTRTRVIGGLSHTYYQQTNVIEGERPEGPYVYAPVHVGYAGTLRSTSDVVTKDFKRRVARGEVFNNPWSSDLIYAPQFNVSFDTRQVEGTGGSWARYYGSGDTFSWACDNLALGSVQGALASYPPPYSVNSLRNQAIIATRNKVSAASAQSWVSLLEIKKTLNMIGDRTRKLADTIQAVKDRDVRRLEFMFPGKRVKHYPRRIILWDDAGAPLTSKSGRTIAKYSHSPPLTPDMLSDAAKLWMEYRYGWRLLVYDIVDTMKAMHAADLRAELIPRTRYTARGEAGSKETVTGSVKTIDHFGPLSFQDIWDHETQFRGYYLYRYVAPEGVLHRLSDFGMFDVPRAIWDIVPWSFVIDHVIPVGDFLGALAPKIGVEELASGIVSQRKLTHRQVITSWKGSVVPSALTWTSPAVPVGSQRRVEYLSLAREVPLGFPTYPPLSVSVKPTHLLDAIALVKGLKSGGFQPFLRK